jgi:hypothetical protein
MAGLGISLILIAVGAVLAFAVSTSVQGVEIVTIGVILMCVGFIGLLMSALFLMTWSPYGDHHHDSPTHRHFD